MCEDVLTCRSSARPSLVGIVDTGCSASPTGTCSSYGRSGCTLPTRLRKAERRVNQHVTHRSRFSRHLTRNTSHHDLYRNTNELVSGV